MSDNNWIPIKSGSGFRIFHTESSFIFVYLLRDEESGKWIQGLRVIVPHELGRIILKEEYLEEKKDDEK